MTKKQIERESFSSQFRLCNTDGTCQHMSRERHDSMPKIEQRRYARDKIAMNIMPDYYGPRGPLFCAALPGTCSSKHCPKRKP